MNEKIKTPCSECQKATASGGAWWQFDSERCKYCAARLIQAIGRLSSASAEKKTERRRAVIDAAVRAGLDEAEIMALAKDKVMAVEPAIQKAKK